MHDDADRRPAADLQPALGQPSPLVQTARMAFARAAADEHGLNAGGQQVRRLPLHRGQVERTIGMKRGVSRGDNALQRLMLHGTNQGRRCKCLVG